MSRDRISYDSTGLSQTVMGDYAPMTSYAEVIQGDYGTVE